jgi:MFS family permease
VAACFGITMIMGETFWSFGVFLKPLSKEFNWGRAMFSSAYSVFMVSYAVSSFIAGRLADRYGPRLVLLVSAFMVGAGLYLSGLMNSINQMRLFFALIGLGAGATWSVPTSTVLCWFRKKQGLALAIVAAGVGFGAMVFALLMNFLIESYGWRQAFFIVALVSLAVVGLCLMFLRETPEKAGLRPYGDTGLPGRLLSSKEGWAMRDAVRTFAFWTVVAAAGVGTFVFNSLSMHLIAYATDVDISPAGAAAAQGLIGGFSILGRLGGGSLVEKCGWKKELVAVFIGTAASVAWLLVLRNLTMLYIFAFVHGVCHGARMVAQTGILGSYFGTRSLGEIIGLQAGIVTMFGALGPLFTGFVFDHSGSYAPALIFSVLFYVVATPLLFRLRPPGKPRTGGSSA